MSGFCMMQKPSGGYIVMTQELLRDEVPLAVVAVEIPL